MSKIDLEKIEALYKSGNYVEAAKLISSIKLWQHIKIKPEILKQQEVISSYARVNHAELRQLIIQFLTMLRKEPGMKKKAFIVHGWDHELKLETKNYFQNTLKIDCIILHEQDGGGDTIINKFERYANECGLAVILLSEKDASGTESFADPNAPKRPRPNVLFEMGYFFSRLGRKAVIILRKGNVEIHSDILGIEYIDVTNGVESSGERIRQRTSWLLTQ
jgi:hypothetical protein